MPVSRKKQRKKYDKDTKGQDKTREGEAQQSGRSSREPSNSRVCWNCNEVKNNYYSNTCPNPQKNKEDSRSVTPYPSRGKSGSKERGGASQGGKTYRMLKGSRERSHWLRREERPGWR